MIEDNRIYNKLDQSIAMDAHQGQKNPWQNQEIDVDAL